MSSSHSQGEYVFDHAWADAWHRAGGAYYPKLQIAAPFTPATGPSLLLADQALALPMLRAAEQCARATACHRPMRPSSTRAGCRCSNGRAGCMRSDIQFHWDNRGYASFDDFLAQLSSRKRKDMRKERAAAQEGR
jgi:predicted N-acyltransferase